MSFPWTDWQFWAVTFTATWGLWTLARQFLPASDDESPCAGCASGAAAQAKNEAKSRMRGGDGPGLVTIGDRG